MKDPSNFSTQSSFVARTAISAKLSHGASIFSHAMGAKISTTTSWWKYDYLAILFVLIPYFVSIFFSCKSPTDWPSTISDLLLVVEVAWTVKFLMAWPSAWTDQLIQYKRNLINYINSIDLDINGSALPESTLNYEVAISNLKAAHHLHSLQKYGFLAEIGGVLVSTILFKWIRSHLSENNGLVGVSDVSISMFLLWGMFKTCVHYTALVQSESAFDSESTTVGGNVTEANLGFVSRLISEKNLAPRDVMERKTATNSNPVSKLVSEEIPHVPHILKEVSVSIMPFPLSLPKKPTVCYPRVSKVLALPVIHEMAEHDLLVHSPTSRPSTRSPPQESIIDGYYSKPSSGQKLPLIRDPLLYSRVSLLSSIGASSPDEIHDFSQESYSFPGFFKHSMAKICEFMNDPENTKSIKLFESLHRRTHDSRVKMFDSAWNLWEYATTFDLHAGFSSLIFKLVFHLIVGTLKVFYGIFFLIPYNLAKLGLAIALFVPRILVRIFVLMPIFLVVKFVSKKMKLEKGAVEFRGNRAQNELPVSPDRFTRSLCKILIAIFSRDRNRYAG